MDKDSTAASQLKARTVFLFVIIFFGAVWAFLCAQSIRGNGANIFTILVALITIGFIIATVLFIRAARHVPAARSPLANRRKRLIYIASIVFEVVVYIVTANISITQHHPERLIPLLAIVVGLHFIGLAYVFAERRYFANAAIFCAIAFIAQLLPQQANIGSLHIAVWSFLIGLVCACVLWSAALRLLYKGRQLFSSPVMQQEQPSNPA